MEDILRLSGSICCRRCKHCFLKPLFMTLLKITQFFVSQRMDLCVSSDHTHAILINKFKNAEVLGLFCLGVQCQTDMQKDMVDVGFISRIKKKLTQLPCWEGRASAEGHPAVPDHDFLASFPSKHWKTFLELFHCSVGFSH